MLTYFQFDGFVFDVSIFISIVFERITITYVSFSYLRSIISDQFHLGGCSKLQFKTICTGLLYPRLQNGDKGK
jgi:hypothetical protein